MDLELDAQPTAALLAALQAGQIDCAFVDGTAPQNGLLSWPVFREELVLVSGQPLAGFPTADQLGNAVFLAFRQGCSYRQRIELLMAARGVPAVRIMELGMLDTILGCVAAGMGYALLPRALVEAQQPRFGVHWCALPPPQAAIGVVDTCFVTGPQASWSPAVRALVKLLQEEVAPTLGCAQPSAGAATVREELLSIS